MIIRGGNLQCLQRSLQIGAWAVEGLTDEKMIMFEKYMYDNAIDILCLQETRRALSDYYISEWGNLCIFSRGNDETEWAGVGFIVAP